VKHPGNTSLFAALLLLVPLQTSLARAGDELEEQLKAEYVGKVLTFRHFYKGDHLAFQADGSLIGLGEVGPWTLDSQVSINSVEVRDRALQIHGRRVWLVFGSKTKPLFDAGTKPYRDVMDALPPSNAADREKWENSLRAKQEVDIEIALASERPGANEASAAMDAVFLASAEDICDFVPDFWRDYFDQIEGRPRMVRRPREPIYSARPGEVSPPHATYTPEPTFSEEARLTKYQGPMVVALVANSSGTVEDVQIVSPLGMGLDERAIASVSTWKFDPAMKNGKPVAVRLEVEVEFHLY